MELKEYRSCMSTNMSKPEFKNLPKKRKKIYFSISAKMCSGKAKDEKNARILVKQDHPEWFDE